MKDSGDSVAPYWELIKEDIGIQPPFYLPYWYTFFGPNLLAAAVFSAQLL